MEQNPNVADWIRTHWPDASGGAVVLGNRLGVFGEGMGKDPRAAVAIGSIMGWVVRHKGTVVVTQLDTQERATWAMIADFPAGTVPDAKVAAGVLLSAWDGAGFFPGVITTEDKRATAVVLSRLPDGLTNERVKELASQLAKLAC